MLLELWLLGTIIGMVLGVWLGNITYDRWGPRIDRLFFDWWDR